MAIKAIIWDMGGVLVRTHRRDGREKWEKALSLPHGTLEEIVFGGESGYLAGIGSITPEQHWDWIYRHLRIPAEKQDAFTNDFWSGDEVDRDLIHFIGELQGRYRTGLITNAWLDIRHMLEDVWGINSVFDEIIVSAEVKLVKPDEAIYRMMLEKLNVKAEESVFVDDFLENIEGARALGMHGIHFQQPEQALHDLSALLNEQAPHST